MSVSEELDYQETIALLQEAVARQVASLLAELGNREETINLLLEQARLFEEAESADRANWEQLNNWVHELEQRVETGGSAGAVREELDGERRRAESERQAFEAERRSWEAQRAAHASESDKLRAMLTQAA